MSLIIIALQYPVVETALSAFENPPESLVETFDTPEIHGRETYGVFEIPAEVPRAGRCPMRDIFYGQTVTAFFHDIQDPFDLFQRSRKDSGKLPAEKILGTFHPSFEIVGLGESAADKIPESLGENIHEINGCIGERIGVLAEQSRESHAGELNEKTEYPRLRS